MSSMTPEQRQEFDRLYGEIGARDSLLALHGAALDVIAALRETLVMLVESIDALEPLSVPAAEPEVEHE